jgi:hypothetical protein
MYSIVLKNVVEYLLRCPHNAYDLLGDEKFVYNLMKIAIKDDHHRTMESFIFVSPAPADMAAKLSAIYRDMAEHDKVFYLLFCFFQIKSFILQSY